MILTLYLPDETFKHFTILAEGQDPRKLVEKALCDYVKREREFLKNNPYDDLQGQDE